MKQLIIYLIQGIFIAICDKIDTAFGNNIDIDSICVLSSFTILTWVTYCIYEIGSYAYRVLISKVKSCLLLTFVISVILGIIIILFKHDIVHIYNLTESQYILFEKCLFIHGLSLPILSIGEFLGNYMLINCLNKQLISSNILLYTIMIVLDYVVYLNKKSLDYLILTTTISYLIYDIVTIIISKILKDKEKIRVDDIKLAIKHGGNIVIDRILGKIATVTYNIYASKLGIELYSIHAICYAVSTSTESITNQCYNYQIYRLKPYKNIKEKFEQTKKILKQTFIPLSILSYIFSIILLIILHGKVEIKLLIIPMMVYSSQSIFIQLYENFRGFLSSIQKTNILRWAGLIGIFVRIPIAIISYYTIGIYGFGMACTLDFTARGIYYYIQSKKLVKNCV